MTQVYTSPIAPASVPAFVHIGDAVGIHVDALCLMDSPVGTVPPAEDSGRQDRGQDGSGADSDGDVAPACGRRSQHHRRRCRCPCRTRADLTVGNDATGRQIVDHGRGCRRPGDFPGIRTPPRPSPAPTRSSPRAGSAARACSSARISTRGVRSSLTRGAARADHRPQRRAGRHRRVGESGCSPRACTSVRSRPAGGLGAEPAPTTRGRSITSIVAERLCDPSRPPSRPMCVILARSSTGRRAERTTLPRAVPTTVEPLPALATPDPRRPNESHTTQCGSRDKDDGPGALAGTGPRGTTTSSRGQ
jgi:hypothetical protein